MTEEEKEAVKYTENCLMKITMGIDCEFDVNILDALINIIKKLQKENEKALAEYMEWQKQELDQKDKIIDLMAETINNHDIDEDICKQMGQKANCNEFEDTEKCKECIKQYFINKAKEIR